MIMAHPGQARALYETMAYSSRIESASPHELVTILYDELLFSFSVLMRALRTSDTHRATSQFTRAMGIIHALEGGLDLDRGGDLAQTLAGIYRSARQELSRARQIHDVERIERLALAFGDLAANWKLIPR